MIMRLEELIKLAADKEKKILSVAVAQDVEVLTAVADAVSLGIVDAVLVGDEGKIREIASAGNIKIDSMRIVDEKDTNTAAAKAVEFVSKGEAHFVMKGMLGTSELLKAVLNKEAGLRSSGLLSHVMIYDVPLYHKLIFLTDGGMIPYPTLEDKIGIIKNAVSVAHSLGIDRPKVAPVCAVEVVNTSMQATIDASVLTVMNRRGQIKGCIVDGPLGLDNAISKEAADHKGIVSEVAGDADILLVPNIESGNFMGKTLSYFGQAENAGIIVGAKCPVVLVSRADSTKSKLYSIALGSILS
jgi:phosphate butyryltransferase